MANTSILTAFERMWKYVNEAIATKADIDNVVKKSGDVMSGSLTVIDNFNINKTFDGVEYKTYVRPLNYALGGEYTTGLIHYKNGVNSSQLLFNKNGVALRDNVAGKLYQLFGQHNADTAATSIRSQLYTYGTNDMTAGTSELATGKLYFVYEIVQINFSIDGAPYTADEGMTWEQFCDSTYNDAGLVEYDYDEELVYYDGETIIGVTPSDVIVSGRNYSY